MMVLNGELKSRNSIVYFFFLSGCSKLMWDCREYGILCGVICTAGKPVLFGLNVGVLYQPLKALHYDWVSATGQ